MLPRQFALVLTLAATAAMAAPQAARGQTSAPLGREAITTLAKVHVLVGATHDSIDAQLAQARNKKDENLDQLRDVLRKEIEAILTAHGLTEAEYSRQTFIVSSDPQAREMFDAAVVVASGAPLPGQTAAPATAAGSVTVPAGPLGTHVGHVMNAFGDTPNRQGLLPTALAEARVAVQHARLAAGQPTNLDYMKTHAGHVINAIDPSIVAAGPGAGYGVKKAALGTATHIELAAGSPGTTPEQLTHAGYVAVAARNTVARADQIVQLAQRVQAATDAGAAAELIGQIVSLTEQLLPGADANGDGRITLDKDESGLQHADDHVRLMLGGR